MSFNSFYAVVLSASATLMGLLFFAVLFNADRRGHRLGASWLSVARSTLNVYIVLVLLPLVLLFPDFDERLRYTIILAIIFFSITRQFIWWRLSRKTDSATTGVAPRLIWLFLGPVTAFGLIGYSALGFLLWRVPFHGSRVSVVVLTLFVIALRNSWNLVLQHAGLTGEN